MSQIDNLIFDSIDFNYDKKKLVQNLNFNFKKGKVNFIAGRSGIGKKTTIAYMINGLLDPNTGKRDIMFSREKNIHLINLKLMWVL